MSRRRVLTMSERGVTRYLGVVFGIDVALRKGVRCALRKGIRCAVHNSIPPLKNSKRIENLSDR
jgi:hypothetical protein